MPANVTCLQREQLSDVGRPPERVLQELGLDVEWRRGDELAVDLGEQEGAVRQRPAVERRQTLDCDFVSHTVVANQDRPGAFQLERL
jgi:hypothetical protein